MRAMDIGHDDVRLVRYPAEADRLAEYRRSGVPRLLVVEAGASPPISADACEDWVRAVVSREDLRVRIAALRARRNRLRVPQVDPTGVLRVGGRAVALSPTETALLDELTANLGGLTAKEDLADRLPQCAGLARRNALHLHITRIRRRIEPLGLSIRTVRGRGYVLEPAEDTTEVA